MVPSCAESAIVKQPACAAAISSSGFVPLPLSKRVPKEYGVSERTPLCVEIEPLPSFNAPDQTAEAVRCMVSSPFLPEANRRRITADQIRCSEASERFIVLHARARKPE